jgi:predicted transcriptional regulator
MQKPSKSPIAVKLPENDRERLGRLAEIKNRSPHWLAKEAISQYLEREEAIEHFKQETIARWEEYRQTGKTVSNDVVVDWLDSWGTDEKSKPPA